MNYRYPLQKLVDLKANEKSQAEWMLSKAIGRLQVEQSTLDKLESERHTVHDSMIQQTAQAARISDLLQMHSYMNHLDEQIHRKHQDVLFARQGVTNMQDQLTEKMKEEKVWVKAKERARDRFLTVVRKKEQDEMDEIAAVRRMELIK